MSGRRNCAECGAAIELQPLPEATRPWRHVDIEDRRVSTCPGASLLAHGALVRVDNDPESDAPWSTFLVVNMDAGLDLESIAEIEEALVTCGEYIGHHDADVELVSHLDRRAVETLVDEEAIEDVRAFVADFWHRGDPSEAEDVEVRRFTVETILDGLAEGNITRAALPSLFRAPKPSEPTEITIAGVRLVLDDETDASNRPWWRSGDSSAWRYTRPGEHCAGRYGCTLKIAGIECGGVEATAEALSARVESQLQTGRRALIERSPLGARDLLALANRLRFDGHEDAAAAIGGVVVTVLRVRGRFVGDPKPRRLCSTRIALCTVAPDGTACCSLDEGGYAWVGGLGCAVADAAEYASRAEPYRCGCDPVRRRNIGVGVMVFAIKPNGHDRVIGVTRYEPTPEDTRREREDRAARSARVRLLVESIASYERGRCDQIAEYSRLARASGRRR